METAQSVDWEAQIDVIRFAENPALSDKCESLRGQNEIPLNPPLDHPASTIHDGHLTDFAVCIPIPCDGLAILKKQSTTPWRLLRRARHGLDQLRSW
jgi:hypothetical protein